MRAYWRNRRQCHDYQRRRRFLMPSSQDWENKSHKNKFTKGKPRKKAALLIAVLPLAVVTLAVSEIKIVRGYAAATIPPPFADAVQKPKGDELTEEFHQTYPLSPTGRVSVANINGDVHINVWDQNSVKVDAAKRAYIKKHTLEVTIDVQN